LKPWDRIEPDRIGDWLDKREKLWKKLDTLDFQRIEINGKKYRPFNVKGINTVLLSKGFLYGAGYGNFSKPTFFLAELSEEKKRGRYVIYFSGREIARDLSAAPAMLQGNTIIARYETMKLFLWGKLEEMKSRKHKGALFNAFSEYGVSKTKELTPGKLENCLTRIAQEEVITYIYHELGEASQRKIMGGWWKDLILRLPYSRAELFVRGLKDVLSDTCSTGMLVHIISNKKAGSLGFYAALHGGFRKIIFPDILTAYDEFTTSLNWALIEKARVEGYKKARNCIKMLPLSV